MGRLFVLLVAFTAGSMSLPALAQELPFRWGFQGSLGVSTGDLKDTTRSKPCLSLGGHLDYSLATNQTLRGRLDMLVFQSNQEEASGTSGGNPWTRSLETKVQGWTLGAEYLIQPFSPEIPVTFGAGLHLVRWSVDSTSTLDLTVGGTTGRVVENTKPTWTKAGISVLAIYRINRRLSAEARLLSSAYGWEGERVHVGQVGLTWTF